MRIIIFNFDRREKYHKNKVIIITYANAVTTFKIIIFVCFNKHLTMKRN